MAEVASGIDPAYDGRRRDEQRGHEKAPSSLPGSRDERARSNRELHSSTVWRAASRTNAPGFTQVSNLIRTLGLTPREEQLVNRLLECWREGQMPWPSVKTLAERMHCSARTVQRTVARLEARGLLVVEYRYRADQSQMSSVYHLAPVLTPVREVPASVSRDDRHPPVTRTAQQETPGEKHTQRSSATGYRMPPTDPSAYSTGRYGALVRR